MKPLNRYCAYITAVIISSSLGIAQIETHSGVDPLVRLNIQNQVNNLYNSQHELGNVINVDSSIGNKFVVNGAIEDPNNIFHGCYIFTAEAISYEDDSQTKGFIGIFKDDQIIWHSDTVIDNSLSVASLITLTADLNNDGNIEIVTSWFAGARGDIEKLWIFSWNGIRLKMTKRYLPLYIVGMERCTVNGNQSPYL